MRAQHFSQGAAIKTLINVTNKLTTKNEEAVSKCISHFETASLNNQLSLNSVYVRRRGMLSLPRLRLFAMAPLPAFVRLYLNILSFTKIIATITLITAAIRTMTKKP